MPSLPLRSPIPASFPFAVHSALRLRVLGSGGKSPNADPSQGRWGLECCSLSPLSAPGFLCASRRQHRGGAGTALAPREPQTGPPCAHLPGFPSPPPLTPSQWLPAPLPRTPYFRPATPPPGPPRTPVPSHWTGTLQPCPILLNVLLLYSVTSSTFNLLAESSCVQTAFLEPEKANSWHGSYHCPRR